MLFLCQPSSSIQVAWALTSAFLSFILSSVVSLALFLSVQTRHEEVLWRPPQPLHLVGGMERVKASKNFVVTQQTEEPNHDSFQVKRGRRNPPYIHTSIHSKRPNRRRRQTSACDHRQPPVFSCLEWREERTRQNVSDGLSGRKSPSSTGTGTQKRQMIKVEVTMMSFHDHSCVWAWTGS